MIKTSDVILQELLAKIKIPVMERIQKEFQHELASVGRDKAEQIRITQEGEIFKSLASDAFDAAAIVLVSIVNGSRAMERYTQAYCEMLERAHERASAHARLKETPPK